jgi:bla regulator protein BlaR1
MPSINFYLMIINDTLLKAISWTLVHSIWQGFLLAILAGIVIVFTRKLSASLRYNLLSVLFLGFLFVVGLTFNHEFKNEKTETITRLNLPKTTIHSELSTFIGGDAYIDISASAIKFLNNNSNGIVLIWFLIFAFKIIGMFTSFSHIYRIRNHKTQLPTLYWKHKLAELSAQIYLNKHIVLLESRLVKVPSVTGFLKPMILIPVGLLSRLSQDQIEAILLHELAHIKRKDYGINILQRLSEMVFFFNPGLLWMSSLLKEERENCCDDIAVAAMKDKTKFVQALVAFEEYNFNSNALVMGFGANKKHLLSRAKRILYSNNKTLDGIEKMALSTGLLLITVIAFACSDVNSNQTQTETASHQAFMDWAESDGQKADNDSEQANIDSKQADIDSEQADIDSKQADIDSRIAAIDSKNAEVQTRSILYNDPTQSLCPLLPIEYPAAAAPATLQEKPAKPASQQTTSESETVSTVTSKNDTNHSFSWESVRTKNGVTKKLPSLVTGITGEDLQDNIDSNQLTTAIISDLISDKIISSSINLSYKLSDKDLIVNGIVQSDSKYKKIRKKYITSNVHAICYNYQW